MKPSKNGRTMLDPQSINTVSTGTRNPAKLIPRPPPAEKISIPTPLCLGGNQFPITLSPGTNTPEKAIPSSAQNLISSGIPISAILRQWIALG